MNRHQVQQEVDASACRAESEDRWIDNFLRESGEIDAQMRALIQRGRESAERDAEFYKQLNQLPF